MSNEFPDPSPPEGRGIGIGTERGATPAIERLAELTLASLPPYLRTPEGVRRSRLILGVVILCTASVLALISTFP